jgi:putative SOS response-associated peptidase YedK
MLQLQLPLGLDLVPRYNIAPSYGAGYEAPIVRQRKDSSRQLVLARWWLIPNWWKKPLKQLPTAFNARAEEISTKPFWRDAFWKRPCLVPATGWREFRGERKAKQAFQLHRGHRLITFAGLWARWTAPEGDVVDSYAIVTGPATPALREIHDRMPLTVPEDLQEPWLASADRRGVLAMLLERQSEPWEIWPVSNYGNTPGHEGPECIERLPEQLLLAPGRSDL